MHQPLDAVDQQIRRRSGIRHGQTIKTRQQLFDLLDELVLDLLETGAQSSRQRRLLEDHPVQLRLAGEGEPGARGGPAGDLYVVLHLRPHETFERHGDDVVCRIELGYPLASLGGEMTVPTLEGDAATLNVPAGTQNGDLLRLMDKGTPNVRSGRRGDQVMQVLIHTPKNLTDRQRALLKELAEIEGAKVRDQAGGSLRKFLSKITGNEG